MKAYKIRPTEDFDSQDSTFRKARHDLVEGLRPVVHTIALDSDGNGIVVIDPKEIEDVRQRVNELSGGMLKATRSK